MGAMKGYKVFNPDWTCKGYQFEVGKTFEEDVKPECCERGFHFCLKAADCFKYYDFDPDNKVAEVIALDEVDTKHNDSKCATNKIQIVREVSWQEVLDLVNLGKACTGFCNSGNKNSGDENSGNKNSGNKNSGNKNSGDENSGNKNSGNKNSGDENSGDENSGNKNSGNKNSGDENSGDENSGNKNSGNKNSGDENSGDENSGNKNSGNKNSGDGNSGDWNNASQTMGCFNTQSQKLRFFDEETDMTIEQWRNSEACWLMNRIDFRPANWIWIWSAYMTDEEKAAHPEHETTGGYLKIRDNADCCTEWWNGLSDREKNIIRSIPNFNTEKFYQITGVLADDVDIYSPRDL